MMDGWTEAFTISPSLFSSPEQKLRVSYCHHPMSVIRHRPSSVVCRQQLVCKHSRGHSFDPILMKLGQNVCLYEI